LIMDVLASQESQHMYGTSEKEDVSEVLGCYSLRVYESPSNLQSNRVTS
jgi:hypothetical protein